jgi:hypothetical protein
MRLDFSISKKIILLLLLCIYAAADLFAANDGPRNGAAAVNTNLSSSYTAWTNPGNVLSADGLLASATVTGKNKFTDCIYLTNFGFNLPVGAVINGIKIEIKMYGDRKTGDNIIQLVSSGSRVGTNKARTNTAWPKNSSYVTFGSSTDNWGNNFTYSDLNSSNFGVAISGKNKKGGSASYYVDHIRITVYYNQTYYYSKSSGDMHLTSTWGSVSDGSGISPSNFTNDGQIFFVKNRSSVTLNGDWNISGNGSKAVLGDGISALSFTIPSGYALNSSVEVSDKTTLNINNTTVPSFDVIQPGCTVVYNAAGNQDISGETFYNLTLGGSGIKTMLGDGSVDNSYIHNSGVTLNNNSYTMSLNGTISHSGIHTGSGSIYIGGPSAQSITGTAGSLGNIEIDNTLGVTLSSAMNMTGTLILTDGNFSAGSNLSVVTGSGISRGFGSITCALQGTGDYDVEYTDSTKTPGNEMSGANIRDFKINLSSGSHSITLTAPLTLKRDMIITGGTLDVSTSNYSIALSGGWVNNGTFTERSGTVSLNGVAPQAINGSSLSFSTLTVNNTSGVSLNGNATIKSSLNLTNGSLALNATTTTLNGTITTTNGAIIGSPDANLICGGSGLAIQLPSVTLKDLTVNRANGVVMNGNTVVHGNLNLTSGNLSVGSNRLTLNGPPITGTLTNLVTTSGSGLTLGGTSSGVSIPGHLASLNNLTVDNLNGVSMNSGLTVSSLDLNNGNLSIGSNTLTLNGTVSRANGGLSGTTFSNIIYSGSGAAVLLPSCTLNNLTVNRANGVILDGNIVTNGTVTLTSGNLTVGANTLTLKNTVSGTASNLIADATSSIIISGSASGINLHSGITQLNNLTLNNSNGSALAADIIVNGTLTLSSGSFNVGARKLTLKNPISGTAANLNAGSTSSISIDGTASGIDLPSVVSALNNLTLNNSNGTTLQGPLNINGSLTLTSGKVNSTSLNLITLEASATATGNSVSFVNGPVAQKYSSTSLVTKTIPSGKDTVYREVLLGIGLQNTTPVTFIIEQHNEVAPVYPMVPSNGLYRVSGFRWFSITRNGSTAITSSHVCLKYSKDGSDGPITDENDLRISKIRNDQWANLGGQVVISGSDGLIKSTDAALNDFSSANDYTSAFSLGSTSPNSPMPVELASFSNTVSGRNVTLKWTTSHELNNSGFNVERRSAVNGNWESINFVEGQGTTNTSHNYIYNDNKLTGTSYNYRLKQVDFNGNFTYYSLNNIVIIVSPGAFSISQNYPNPFNPVTSIDYDLPEKSNVKIEVMDISGRQISVLANEIAEPGYHTVKFNGLNLSSGIYFYRITAKGESNSFTVTKKMMLIK